MNANLYALLEAGFPADRSACALETIDAQGRPLYYSWDDIDRASARIANLLASLKLPAGARVAVQVEKSPEALLLYLATLRAGYVYLPLNTAYQAAEIDYFVGNAEPALVVCAPGSAEWITPIAKQHRVKHVMTLGDDRTGSLLDAAARQPDRFRTVRRAPDDMAAILYTSGTTGRSKGAMLSHDNLASNAQVLKHYWRWRRGDVLLHALPIFHVHGLFVASHGALLAGCKMIWMAKFDPREVVRQLPRATVFMGVPTMYVRLLDEPSFDAQACRTMRLFISGSAPLLPDTFRQFEQRTGTRILERYGMSETVMLTSNPYDGNRVAGTVGLPLPGVEVRVVDEHGRPCAEGEIGAIQVRGPNVFSGYWRMPEKTREEFTEDRFFRTGDMGKWDANGYLSIVGRGKDLIITGGYNVYPKEIESYLDELPGVFESAVIGVPHRDFGEAVTAVVVPKPGATLDEAQLIAALKGRIANFKVPKRVHVVPELPRNQMGKVQKNLLRERFGG
ncbi:MAG TPA: malonyl-CoA synthase [Quisquiliibacterium sp.]|nr:malonyl-CoA synthase [Quisquiliibacterium sp.]HPA90097.1 malonyl-CoA synthase [Quisquiliibacterium sp.]